jgi:peptidoglycan/LPS O-acetylase OafA/YrhL
MGWRHVAIELGSGLVAAVLVTVVLTGFVPSSVAFSLLPGSIAGIAAGTSVLAFVAVGLDTETDPEGRRTTTVVGVFSLVFCLVIVATTGALSIPSVAVLSIAAVVGTLVAAAVFLWLGATRREEVGAVENSA